MTWQLSSVLTGLPSAYLDADRGAFARAATTTLRRNIGARGRRGGAEGTITKQMRSNVERRLGRGMSRAARAATFPNTGNSYTPSGHIWFESSRRTRDGNIDIIEVFSEGRTVTPRRAKLLWVPTDAGRRLGNVARNKPRDLTPSTFGQQLQYIPIRGRSRNARVVARLVLRRDPTVTVFIGLRRVRLRRRLRLDSIWQRGITRYEGQRNRAWERFYQTEARGIEKRRARFRRELVRAVL